MWRRTLDSWGYSPLDQIDRDNVDNLQMVWTRALSQGMQQGTVLALFAVADVDVSPCKKRRLRHSTGPRPILGL